MVMPTISDFAIVLSVFPVDVSAEIVTLRSDSFVIWPLSASLGLRRIVSAVIAQIPIERVKIIHRAVLVCA